MQLLECSAMNGLQKLQQKLKNGDFFMIQKAVSQALTVFFCVKKLLKKDASLPVIFLSLLRFFYRPPISFLAPDFFPRPPKNLSLNDNDNVNVNDNDNVNVNVNDNDNDLFLFGKKKQKARA